MIHTTSVAAPELRLDVLSLKKASALLRAIKHPLRQSILLLLHQRRELCVSELYGLLRLDQSVASHHLSILRRAGVAVTRRKGRQIFYTVNEERLRALERFAAALLCSSPAKAAPGRTQ